MADPEVMSLSPRKKKKKLKDGLLGDASFSETPRTKKSKKKIRRKKVEDEYDDENEKSAAELYMRLHMSACTQDSYNWQNSSIRKSSSTAGTVSTAGSSMASHKSPRERRKNKISVRKVGEGQTNPNDNFSQIDQESLTASFSPPPTNKKRVSKDLISLTSKGTKSEGARKPDLSATSREKEQKLRTSSGCGLDELMKQSVHEHTRKQITEKPTLVRTKSNLGELFRRANTNGENDSPNESAEEIPKRSNSSRGGLKRSKSALGDLFRRKSDLLSPSPLPTSKGGGKAKLPKNIKEIDGILWRVDEEGNKLEKIYTKSLVCEPDEYTTTSGSVGNSSMGKIGRKNKAIRRKPLKNSNGNESDNEATTTAGQSLDAKIRRKNRKVRRKAGTSSEDEDDGANTTAGYSLDAKLESRLARKIRYGRRKNDVIGRDNRSAGSDVEEKLSSSSTSSRSKSIDRRPAIRGRTLKMTRERLDESESSLYLDEIPNPPKRSNSKGNHGKGKKKKKQPLGESTDFESSSCLTYNSGDPIVVDLQDQLMKSRREVWRLQQSIEEQSIKLQEIETERNRMQEDLELTSEENQNIIFEMERLKLKLELREQDLERTQQALDNHVKLAAERPSGDHLIDQITDLMCENNTLVDKMGVQQAEAGMRYQKKEEEVRYLQMELDRMRADRGEKDLEIDTLRDLMAQQQREGGIKPANTSLQLVDKIWKQRKDATDKAQRKQIKELQERVEALVFSNNKLKKEIEESTLEINSDDDDELRKAKEMAEAVSRGRLTRTRSANAVKRRLARSKSPGPALSALINRTRSGSMTPTFIGAKSAVWNAANRGKSTNFEHYNDN